MGDVAFALPVVVATLLYATNVNYIKYQLHALKPLEIAAFALVLAGIPSFVYLSMGTGFWGKVLPLSSAAGSDAVWQSLMAVGILGAVGSALSLWLFFMLVASAGPLSASAITYLMPVVALGWALLDGESPGWMHVTALGLILVGVWLVGKKPAHPKTQ
jgi:drug/metabolite transporter (DMT)-like permease